MFPLDQIDTLVVSLGYKYNTKVFYNRNLHFGMSFKSQASLPVAAFKDTDAQFMNPDFLSSLTLKAEY